MKVKQKAYFILLFLLFTISQTFAATRTVCSSGATYTTIQAAITAASAGDTISICDGTYNERNIQITKNNLTILGASGNRDNVIVNRSGDNIFVIKAANATIKNLTIVSSTYGIRDNYQASGSHTFENLAFSTTDTSIYLSNTASACTFKNLDITTNISGIYLDWSIDGAHTFEDITISAGSYYGIYAARGAGSFSNIAITSGNTGIYLGSKYLATFDTIAITNSSGYGINLNSTENYSYSHTFSNLSIDSYDTGLYVERGGKVIVNNSTITSSAGYGIYFESAVSGAHEFSNITISSYYTGIYCLSGLALIEDFDITSEAWYGIQTPNNINTIIHRGTIASYRYSIYITSGSSKTVTIEDTILSSQISRGIYLVACSSALINRVCITKATNGIYTEWNANSITITNTKISSNSSYGVSINSNSSSGTKATVTNNCFLTSPFAYRNSTTHVFTGNYWNGTAPSGYDTSPLSSCPVSSCYTSLPVALADYHFDECSWKGTDSEVEDNSSNGYNGTLKLKTMVLQSGKISRAPTLFSDDSYIEIANFPNLTGNMSITGWFNTTDRTALGQRIFEDDASNSNGYGISVGDGGSGTIRFYDRSQTNSGIIDSDTVIQNDTWYFVAAMTDINNSIRTLMIYDSSGTLLSQKTATMSNLSRGSDNGVVTIGGEAVGSGEEENRFKGSLDEIKVFSSTLSSSQIDTILQNEIAGKNYDGTTRSAPVCNICQSIKSSYATTTDGYYYVNETIASSSNMLPFEIYCENMNTDTNITQYLPTVINESNSDNSNFKFNTITSSKYYTSTDKTYFSKIKIDENISAATDFMSSGFSNINLVGTPFQIDLNNTTLGTCDSATDTSQLKIGHYNQAIKIDPTVETKTYCTASKMPFQQISNYYAKDAYINFTTCAQIAQNSSSRPSSGYYLLKKAKQTTGEGNYIVAYCEMNPPVSNQIWTLFLALDARTTNQKSDVVDGNDTCSKVGYSFFTPNQKSVMEAAKSFLYDRKSEWSDYTGTVREYFTDYGITGWATDSSTSVYKPDPIPDGPMWPYGPFGIYKPTSGGSSGDKLIAMSTSFLSTTDINDSFGSLDSIGWKSVLPEISSAYEDTWWVTDIAAGYARNTSGHLVRISASIEPNGDYDANNWLGWFADANGSVIHYNDQNGNNRYRYSNYMCTSQDMYTIVDTSWDTWGFDAWDLTKSISLRTISTKKVAEGFSLTIASLNSANTDLSDFNGTVCVRIVDDTNLSLNGDGTSLYFNSAQTQTASNFNITKAVKDARVLLSWKENVNTTCPLSTDANSTLATDNFAIRPDSFTISNATSAYAGDIFQLDFKALNALSANSTDYNETKDDSFGITAVIGKSGCASGTFTVSDFSFANGQKLAVDSNFSDVGDINITIEETVGSEFAKIDTSDTNESNRLISPATLVVTVNPYELNITDANFTASTGLNWLYDANVSDMYVNAHATVQANNMQHEILQNFTDACYAQPVNLTFYYDVNNTNTDTNLSYVIMSGTMTSSLKPFSDVNKTITIPTTLFTTASASADYRFNVDRAYNVPLSPIVIALHDVNVTSTDVAKNENNVTNIEITDINQTKYFYYGRVKTKDIVTDKTLVSHLLHVEIYSSTTLNGFYQNSLNWYINSKDDGTTTLVDGNFSENSGFTNNQASTSIAISGSSGVTDGILRFNINNLLGEQASMVHVDVPYWLWNSSIGDYNNSTGATCANHPCFNYKYSRDVDKVGIKSGTTSGSTISRDYNTSYQKTGVKTFR